MRRYREVLSESLCIRPFGCDMQMEAKAKRVKKHDAAETVESGESYSLVEIVVFCASGIAVSLAFCRCRLFTGPAMVPWQQSRTRIDIERLGNIKKKLSGAWKQIFLRVGA